TAAQPPANGIHLETIKVNSAAAEQRREAVDGGDFIATPGGPRKLLRWSGAVAVTFDVNAHDNEAISAITGKGAVLEDYATHTKSGKQFVLLKGNAAE